LLIKSARNSKIPIFYTTIEMLPIRFESSSRLYTYTKIFANLQKRSIPQPHEKRDLSLAIEKGKEEIVITKHTASIFVGTDLKE
jgi:nicotinamidase-related amidase